jgi:hypothetical protein
MSFLASAKVESAVGVWSFDNQENTEYNKQDNLTNFTQQLSELGRAHRHEIDSFCLNYVDI